MSMPATGIAPFVQAELDASSTAERDGLLHLAFRHLERAHVLSQLATTEHVRVHGHMFRFALRRRHYTEAVGQALRMLLAALFTGFGALPTGNTGGSDVSLFEPMTVPADLQKLIDAARSGLT